MRITNKSVYSNYLGELENIQNRKFKEETRMVTGKRITGIEDEPDRLAEIKILHSKMSKNVGFGNILEQTLAEMKIVSDSLDFMSDTVKTLRQTALDSIQTGSSQSAQNNSSQIKSLLEDILSQANSDFNGRTLFSGTATTGDSVKLDPADPNAPYSKTELPFELIETPPTTSNPSGLKVIFKGNNNDRLVNKDSGSTEVTNVKSKDIFGENLELFNDIIGIYNKIKYNGDGSLRGEGDVISKTDIADIDVLQKTLLDHDQKMTNTTAIFGAKYNRLDALSQQIINENLMLKEINSSKEDTDVAKTTIALKLEETALQYSLQVGAKIMQNSLFDFLS